MSSDNSKKRHFSEIELPTFSDFRGSLTVLEKEMPFPIRRVFWMYGADGKTRGGHRHNRTRLALVSIIGEVVLHMDDGVWREDILLNSPKRCVLVEPKDWHTMHFGASSVLLVFASDPYDPADYIYEPYQRGTE